MAREMRFGLVLWLRDQASRGVKALHSEVRGLGAELRKGFGAGVGGGFAKMFGGGAFGALAGKLATRPGGAGGILSDVVKGAAGLALLPVRILNSFASLIPGVGGIISGVVGTAANILQGLIGIVANIAGGILNVVTSLLQKVLSVVGTILGKVVKIGGTIGLGLGAAVAAATIKGIAGNLQEMRLKAVLKRRLGAAWEGAWKEIERLSPVTGFEETALADALVILSRTDLSRPAQYLEGIADAAVGAGVSLTEVANLFAQVAARGEDLGRAKMQLFNLGIPKAQVDSIKDVAGLAAVLQARFGGVAREVARLQPMQQLWRAVWEDVEALTEGLTEALVPALNKVVQWLDRLRGTEAFKRINEEIKRAVGGAIEWIGSREVSWDSLKTGLLKLWQDVVPALGELVVDTLKWAAAEAKVIFVVLWESVGSRLAESVRAAMLGVARGMVQARQAAVDVEVSRFHEAERLKAERFNVGAPFPTWKELTPEKQAEWRAGWYAQHPAEAAISQAVARIGGALGFTAGAIQKGKEEADAFAAELGALRQEAAAARANMAGAGRALGQAAAGAGAAAFPAAPEAPRGPNIGGAFAAAGQPIAGLAAVAPQAVAYQQWINQRENVAAMLEKSGLKDKAAQLRGEAAALRAEMEPYLAGVVGALEGHRKELNDLRRGLQSLSNRMKNLGTARS